MCKKHNFWANLNDVDTQQILEFNNSFGKSHPKNLYKAFFWDTLYILEKTYKLMNYTKDQNFQRNIC